MGQALTENPGVGGSTPPLGTTLSFAAPIRATDSRLRVDKLYTVSDFFSHRFLPTDLFPAFHTSHAAKLIIDGHGAGAPIQVAMRADELMDAGEWMAGGVASRQGGGGGAGAD